MLLSRTTRRVQLTDAGELAYRQADQMIALHEQLLDGLQRRRSALCGSCASRRRSLGRSGADSGAAALSPDHPEVRIIADFSNTPADLLRDNLHVAFRSTELGTQPHLARPIAVDDLVLCASADYLDRHPPLTTPQDLHPAQPHHPQPGVRPPRALAPACPGARIPLEVAGELAFSSKKAIHQGMRQGLGIARLPRYLVAAELAEGWCAKCCRTIAPGGPFLRPLYPAPGRVGPGRPLPRLRHRGAHPFASGSPGGTASAPAQQQVAAEQPIVGGERLIPADRTVDADGPAASSSRAIRFELARPHSTSRVTRSVSP